MSYPYQKHIWVTKEIIRRDYLQNIEDGIYDEQQDRISSESTLNGSITAETTRATAAETTIANNLSREVTRATAAELDLSDSISDEETRATTAESELSDRISNEYTRATTAEDALSTRLSTVETTMTTAYKASGSIYFADLPALTADRRGNIYNIKDSFTTTSNFVEGAGYEHSAGSNVAIVGIEEEQTVITYEEVTPIGTENPTSEGWYEYDEATTTYVLSEDTSVDTDKTYYESNTSTETVTVYKYDVMSGFIDTSDFITNTDYATTVQAGVVKPDGTTITVVNGVISSVGGGQGSAEAAERMIAPIEADDTSSANAYSVGDSVIVNEILYTVTAAIAVGDALVVGTNIAVSDDISEQLSNKVNISDLANVATSGDYNDLSNTPTLGTAAAKDFTSSVTSGSSDLVTSGAVANEVSTLNSALTNKAPTSHASSATTYGVGTTANYGHVKTINNLTTSSYSDGQALSAYQGYLLKQTANNKVLYYTGQACSATTGDFCTISNSAITANHVVAECIFANPSYITTDVTWTTASGSLTLNGTCSTATTVNVVLVKKDN